MPLEILFDQLSEVHLQQNINLVAQNLSKKMIKNALGGGFGTGSLSEGEVLKVFYPQITDSGDDLHGRIWKKAELLLAEAVKQQKLECSPNSLDGFNKNRN